MGEMLAGSSHTGPTEDRRLSPRVVKPDAASTARLSSGVVTKDLLENYGNFQSARKVPRVKPEAEDIKRKSEG